MNKNVICAAGADDLIGCIPGNTFSPRIPIEDVPVSIYQIDTFVELIKNIAMYICAIL